VGTLDEFALADSESFADYCSNDVLALVCEAWLGLGYQVTSQINVVNPGGTAQVAHRDYHLGFMSAQQSLTLPVHVHRLSPTLTWQGGVAHFDMPIVTGPTLYLPHSQRYELGYVAGHLPEFRAYFRRALRAAAAPEGRRCLLQPGGPPRRRDEPPVLRCRATPGTDVDCLRHVVAASAEGYPFPADLDQDQPNDGLAPQSQADVVRTALAQQWSREAFEAELQAQASRRTRLA
jgi:hypothetical protein